MAALSQLSYSPKLVIGSHCNADPLVVLRGRQTQMKLRFSRDLGDRHVVAALERIAVDRQWIKLIDRLSEIDNPSVATNPASAPLVVKPKRASVRHQGE
jgi:hypothetical protein